MIDRLFRQPFPSPSDLDLSSRLIEQQLGELTSMLLGIEHRAKFVFYPHRQLSS